MTSSLSVRFASVLVSETMCFSQSMQQATLKLFLSLTIDAGKICDAIGFGGLTFSKRITVYQLHVPPCRCITYAGNQVACAHMPPMRPFSAILHSHPTTLCGITLVRDMEVSPGISFREVSLTLWLAWAADHVVSFVWCSRYVYLVLGGTDISIKHGITPCAGFPSA